MFAKIDQSPLKFTSALNTSNLANTPTRINDGVKYYRVDKNGNKIELDGPLTPLSPLTPINRESSIKKMTDSTLPSRFLVGGKTDQMAESRTSLGTEAIKSNNYSGVS